MPSNRNESESNARLLDSLFGSAPAVPPTQPDPAPSRPRRTRRATTATAAAVATAMTAASVGATPAQPARNNNTSTAFSGYVGETTGLEQKEVRAIELCARKMELLALRQAVESELQDLDAQLNRLKRSA